MELKFRNITKCSKGIYNQFLEFHNEKYKKRDALNVIFIVIIMLYMLIFNIAYHNYILGFIVVITTIVYFIGTEYKKRKITTKEMKSSKIRNNEEIEFCFYNRFFIVITNKENKKIRYYELYKVHNDEKNFYIYIDKTHAFIISKNGFVKGTVSEFQKFIFKRCWIKNLIRL